VRGTWDGELSAAGAPHCVVSTNLCARPAHFPATVVLVGSHVAWACGCCLLTPDQVPVGPIVRRRYARQPPGWVRSSEERLRGRATELPCRRAASSGPDGECSACKVSRADDALPRPSSFFQPKLETGRLGEGAVSPLRASPLLCHAASSALPQTSALPKKR